MRTEARYETRFGGSRRYWGSTVLVLMGLFVSACGTPEPTGSGAEPGSDERWGPLAVVESANGLQGGMDALAEGTLFVSDECVTLDDATTLVWLTGRTSWDATAKTIVFTESGDEVRLVDGDEISAAGGAFSISDEFPTWLAEPRPSCPEPQFLVMHEVRVTSD